MHDIIDPNTILVMPPGTRLQDVPEAELAAYRRIVAEDADGTYVVLKDTVGGAPDA